MARDLSMKGHFEEVTRLFKRSVTRDDVVLLHVEIVQKAIDARQLVRHVRVCEDPKPATRSLHSASNGGALSAIRFVLLEEASKRSRNCLGLSGVIRAVINDDDLVGEAKAIEMLQ